MTPNASKQGKFGSLGAVFLFIFLPCVWGLGFQKESRDFRDSRDSSGEKTPFVMTPFPGPEKCSENAGSNSGELGKSKHLPPP